MGVGKKDTGLGFSTSRNRRDTGAVDVKKGRPNLALVPELVKVCDFFNRSNNEFCDFL